MPNHRFQVHGESKLAMFHAHRLLPMLTLTLALQTSVCAQPVSADTDPTDSVQQERAFARSLSRAFQAAAESADPVVVHIKSIEERPEIRRDFFTGRTFEQMRKRQGLGSGVIVRTDGYILTNNHVIQDATQVEVRLADGTEHSATVIGTDELRDLAVLKISSDSLPAATFADSDLLEVGQWVIALGSPFGFERTVTAGIVSAKGRGLGIASDQFKDFEEFIQTDAAINPGNSGGPLIDLEGNVVGINTAIFSRAGGSIGLGFAIPSNLARDVVNSLIENGAIDRGFLGIEMRDVDNGVEIVRIREGSPAEESDLREGDIVQIFNGRPITSTDTLMRAIQFSLPGSQAELSVLRDGDRVATKAWIGDTTTAELARVAAYNPINLSQLGLIVADPEAVFTSPDPIQGAVIANVSPQSPASRAGLRARDLIVRINRQAIESSQELNELLSDQPSGRVEVEVRRPVETQRGRFDWTRGVTTLNW